MNADMIFAVEQSGLTHRGAKQRAGGAQALLVAEGVLCLVAQSLVRVLSPCPGIWSLYWLVR